MSNYYTPDIVLNNGDSMSDKSKHGLYFYGAMQEIVFWLNSAEKDCVLEGSVLKKRNTNLQQLITKDTVLARVGFEESGKVKSELVFESKENFGYRNLKVEKAKEWGRIDILHAWAEKSWVMIW